MIRYRYIKSGLIVRDLPKEILRPVDTVQVNFGLQLSHAMSLQLELYNLN